VENLENFWLKPAALSKLNEPSLTTIRLCIDLLKEIQPGITNTICHTA
jgi:hypothetical protein